MVSTPSPPAVPDPVKTANAQASANKTTAITQSELNQIDQNTPQGTLKYTQIGTNADGTPKFSSTQTYSPGEQGIYDTGVQTRQNVANIGQQQSSRIGDLLNTPFNVDTATADKIQGLQNEFLDPQWNRQQDSLQTQLINKGLRPGSQQYQQAMNDFSNQRQKGYDQSYLDSYSKAQQAALTERNQPINEISALMSGSQVSQPNYTTTPNTGVAPTDVIGAYNLSQNAANANYQAQLGQSNAFNSGLFGLGSTALGGWMMSDRRLKEDVKKVGKLDSGLPVYSFRYKDGAGGGLMQLGLMAQDVEKTMPEAVAETDSGYKAVNYSTVAEKLDG